MTEPRESPDRIDAIRRRDPTVLEIDAALSRPAAAGRHAVTGLDWCCSHR